MGLWPWGSHQTGLTGWVRCAREQDPNVPLTKTDRFRRHMRDVRKEAEAATSPAGKLKRSGTAGGSLKGLEGQFAPGSMRPIKNLALAGGLDGQKTAAAPRGPQNQSTASGGLTEQPDPSLTYGRDDTVAPELELEVLKAILLREGYLHRIAEVAGTKEAAKTVPTALPDLLDLCRIATVEVVEAVASWRSAQRQPLPFDWNGINYLLKIPSDLDFLAANRPLVAWLGFDLARNPFVVPLPLEAGRAQVGKAAGPGRLPASGDTGGFTAVGTLGNVTVKATGGWDEGMPSKPGTATAEPPSAPRGGRAAVGPEGRPYATAVVNDQSVAPVVAPTTGGAREATPEMGASRGGVGFAVSRTSAPSKELASSAVQDVDMLRVREVRGGHRLGLRERR